LQRLGEVADRAAEAADQAELLLVELEEVDLAVDAGGRAAGDQRAARLRQNMLCANVSGPTCPKTTSTPPSGDLADRALEAVSGS
jgi:hypothetical protein